MLTELRISNFAVIDRVSLQFSRGFHVLTGETGAGKSILVDAIALLVGGRASTDQIRADAEEAELEGAFSLSEGPLVERLRDGGVLEAGEHELVIRRVLSRSGRHRIYLNGRLAPLRLIQDLGGTLVDIHGQHDQQSLLSPDVQLDALDALANARDLRTDYTRRYQEWRAEERRLEEAVREAAVTEREEELLRFQCRELQEANLQPGEEEDLLAERNRLGHAQRLQELAGSAHQALYAEEASVLSGLGSVGTALRELNALDPRTEEWGTLNDSATVQLRELAHQLRDYLQHVEQNPARLGEVEERLDLIQRLKRKYGGTVEAVLARTRELTERLERLETAESSIEDLRASVEKLSGAVQVLADKLSDVRGRAGCEMALGVKKHVAALRMGNTRFEVAVRRESGEASLTATGRDRVEYLVSTNPGEPLLPVAKVASGGELSRLMLAIKTVLAKSDRVPVLIFDEVDAGVGGAVAEVMGRSLRALGAHHQVFCITHLPQIASQAEHHFVVEKSARHNRTVAEARLLDDGGRREEIARMLGGETITKAVRETAAEMIGGRRRSR